ncbi:helix-turn-helix transcriptional regulator [Paenibacillus xylanexedens]|uniref:AraC-like DNA-binding protein n=2 Tax=Paenibacillus xylanexedens TaxID=528191 RepID=A0ABS4RTL9_PAEXY|nr:AraC-like DNA-binding protein [Paenibacillus xylanexedens]
MWWIENQFDYVIRLDQMAADVHLSKSYAYCIFHQETGSSITEHVKARRLKQDYHSLR